MIFFSVVFRNLVCAMAQSVKRRLLTSTARVEAQPVYVGSVVDRVALCQVCL